MQRRVGRLVGSALVAAAASTGVVLAHGGGLRAAAPERLVVPTWLFLATGGGVIGVSFLLASLITDRDLLTSLHEPLAALDAPRASLATAGRTVGVLALALVVATGVLAPQNPLRNTAILVVWVGWWAGFTMLTYTVGNPWPALDPFRAVAGALPASVRDAAATVSRERASWLSAFGLLALFAVEVVSPLAEDGVLLSLAVVAYLGVSLAGVALAGFDTWYDRIDPLTRVFRLYGAVAPVGRTENGSLALRLPGVGLTRDLLDGWGGVAFVVALVWGTTFDGLVSTPAWASLARAAVGAGVPALVLYLGTLVAGFGVFLGVYRAAAQGMRRTAPTYVATHTLARRFAPSLVAIAAGYHLAHNLTYFLSLLPTLAGALASPVSPPAPATLPLPTWVSALPLAFVLAGHLLAVLVAHAVTFELFAGRLQAIRSQYALTAIMVLYTMTSLWIVSQPSVAPPYL